jgi:hypothetical protein
MGHRSVAQCSAEAAVASSYPEPIVHAAFADAKPTKETLMKQLLKQAGILAAGLFCATQALAGWSDVADEKELRAVQASSTFHGSDVYGRAFITAFEQDGTAMVEIDRSHMTIPWHFAGDRQLCLEWQEGTECYRLQKNDAQPGYRALRVRDGDEMAVLARRAGALAALSR